MRAAPLERRGAKPARAVIQRSRASATDRLGQEAGASVESALASPSRSLDPGVRSEMEPRFGYDFSRVRVHADESASTAARALNAHAFTVGDHIVFAAGKHAPASSGGRRLLAHELAHVVQQGAGGERGDRQVGDYRLSAPHDRSERAADAVADAVTRPGAPAEGCVAGLGGGEAGPGVIHRFLAGEGGHGGIEEDALQEAGFTKDEAHDTYFGNWLRDFSQIPPSEDESAIKTEFIKVLATGEFGRAPSHDELGRYLASEHVDRPEGGDSAENPDIGVAQREKRRGKLGSSQQAWFDEEQTSTFQANIRAASAASGLPEYIERAKEHAKRQIAEAAHLGRTPAGELALGNGLHVVEDYFAHSNFIEVALAQLRDAGEITTSNPLMAAVGNGNYHTDPTRVVVGGKDKDAQSRPNIVTGTSAPGPSEKVGLMEVLRAELAHPQLRAAFFKGAAIRYGWDAARAGGRSALGAVGGAIGGVLGGAAGAVKGLVTGAGEGAAAGWRSGKHWWSKPFKAIGGFFKGAFTGAGRGARSGWSGGRRTGERVGGAVGGALGALVGLGLTPAVYAAMYSLYMSIGVPALSIWSPDIDKTIADKTRETIDPTGRLNPTHSQIAKDDIAHPLHAAAARLAHSADVAIGQAMLRVWKGQQPVADAQRLVDLYLAHPAAVDWWKPTLKRSATDAERPKKR